MNLSARFLIAAVFVIGTAMVVFGDRITKRIEDQVLLSTAISEALVMDREIAPITSELLHGTVPTLTAFQTLDNAGSNFTRTHKLLGIKIWDSSSTIVYATKKDLIGQKFPIDDDLAQALKGNVTASFNNFDDIEVSVTPSLNQHSYDVHFPIMSNNTPKTVQGVAEFYLNANALQIDVNRARYKSWLEVGGFACAMVLSLFAIVQQGSKTITRQREELGQKLAEQARLMTQNAALQRNLDESHRESIRHTEQILQRLGADLHDGPAQNLSFVLLQIDKLFSKQSRVARSTFDMRNTLRDAVAVALKEIRDISTGLALPEIEVLSSQEVILTAVRDHEQRTHGHVEVQIGKLANTLTYADKVCVYRVVQEGLNNSFHHAGAKGQSVEATQLTDHIIISVKDQGPGIERELNKSSADHLGLIGLKHRAEALGGSFEVISSREAGTVLKLKLPTRNHVT